MRFVKGILHLIEVLTPFTHLYVIQNMYDFNFFPKFLNGIVSQLWLQASLNSVGNNGTCDPRNAPQVTPFHATTKNLINYLLKGSF